VSAGALRLSREATRHRRGVAHALLDVAGVQVAVASLHMSLYADERARHLPAVLSVVEQYGAPVVLAGDLNEQPDGAVWRELAVVTRTRTPSLPTAGSTPSARSGRPAGSTPCSSTPRCAWWAPAYPPSAVPRRRATTAR
jgi:endonuclease/exonuclease/phosphatase family metal-dependent hydrolase